MRAPDDLNLFIAASQSSPAVEADWSTGILKMSGESYPENTYDLFDQVIAWIARFLSQSSRPILIELRLSYLNTSSIRAMIDIFDLLQDAHDGSKSVEVNWYFDSRNPRASELGQEFKEDYSFPFLIAETGGG